TAGGVSIPDWRGRPTPEFLQLVIGAALPAMPQSDHLVPTADSSCREFRLLRHAYQYATPLIGFLRREMKFTKPVRCIPCLSHAADNFAWAGAYFAIKPAFIGAADLGVGRPTTIVNALAHAWLGAGIRLLGNNAQELTFGLSGAMSLWW